MPSILIRGGHSGIGLECSKYIAENFRLNLVLAGRSLERMNPAAQELRTAYGVKVSTLKLDTSSLDSVRSAAAKVQTMLDNKEIDSLQGIICNAGVRLNGPVSYSADGYEETFAANYLGHFLLVELLLGRLEDYGRIVYTVSGTHDPDTTDGRLMGIAEPDALLLANTGKDGKKPISAGKLYATSKLCMILHTYELDRRLRKAGSSVAAIAYDPGATSGTGFLRDMPKFMQWLSETSFMNWVFKRLGVTMGSVDFSGAALAKIAADPAYAGGSGKYFQSSDGKLIERRSSKMSYDEQRASKLWNDTERLVHLQSE